MAPRGGARAVAWMSGKTLQIANCELQIANLRRRSGAWALGLSSLVGRGHGLADDASELVALLERAEVEYDPRYID